MDTQIILPLVHNAALLLVLAVLYDLIPIRPGPNRFAAQAINGMIIGLIAIAVMTNPLHFSPGVVFDTRSVLLSMTGLFFGTIPAVIAAIIAALYRFLGGGAGTWVGIGVIATSAGIGIFWQRVRSQRNPSHFLLLELYLLGIVVHVVMLLLMLFLPWPIAVKVLSGITIPVMLIYPVGTVLLGRLLAIQQERRKSVGALTESESRYRSLFESNNAVILLIDPESGAIRDANAAACRYYGWPREEMIQKGIADINTLSMNEIKAELDRAARDERNHFFFKHRLADGSVRDVEIYSGTIRVEGEDLLYSLVFDVTDRLMAEKTLNSERKRFKQILDAFPNGIYIVNADYEIDYVNPRLQEEFGAVEGQKCHEYLHDLPAPCNWCPNPKVLQGERVEWEWYNPANDRMYDLYDIPLYNDDGTVSKIEFFHDITERKRAEENQRNLEEQLFHAQKMDAVGRLAGGVAHDFNNLLSIILGYGDMMLEEMKPDHPDRSSLQEIYNAGVRAQKLTRQLLAFSRRQVLDVRIIDVNTAVSGFAKMMHRLIGEDIELKLNISTNEVRVKADMSQLEQVLMNLAVNARDAMPDGGELSIETGIVELDQDYAAQRPDVNPGTYGMVAVRDNGTGMDSETLHQIFEPFFSTKEKSKGTGLGLSMVYGIVKQHGGNIWVYSEPGHGTIFKIYLPHTADEDLSFGENSTSIPVLLGSATVMVVEDDPGVKRLVCNILSGKGYKVLETRNVDHAIALAREHNGEIHLVLTDVIMPGMNGPALYQKIVQYHPESRVLYMSGYTENIITRQGVLMEGIHFLEKPFSTRKLLKKIGEILTGEG